MRFGGLDPRRSITPLLCSPHHRLELSLIYILLHLACFCTFSQAFLDCYSEVDGPVVVAEGVAFDLTCNITQKCRGPCDVSTVYFKNKGIEYRDNIRILSNHSARIRLEADIDNFGHYYCYVSDPGNLNQAHSIVPCPHNVDVGRPPLKPVITGCKVLDWDKITCDWLPSVADQDNHTRTPNSFQHRLELRLQNSDEMLSNCTLPKPEKPFTGSTAQTEAAKLALTLPNHCSLSISEELTRAGLDVKKFCVRVVAINSLSVNVSNESCYNIHSIVKPKTPEGLKVEKLNSTAVRLSWTDQTDSFNLSSIFSSSLPLIYSITYKSEWAEKERILQVEGANSLILSVIPHSDYEWSISARPALIGYTSDQSELDVFYSDATVPCAGAQLINGSFSLKKIGNSETRQVFVYWKPISKQQFCGPDFKYIVRYNNSDGSNSELVTTEATASFTLHSSGTELQVGVANQQGTNERLWSGKIIIPDGKQDDVLNDMELTMEGNLSSVYISWTLPKSMKDRRTKSAIIFTCRKSIIPHCSKGIDWRILDNVNSSGMTVPLSDSYDNFFIGLSLTLHGGTEDQSNNPLRSSESPEQSSERSKRSSGPDPLVTGIKWAGCVYHMSGGSPMPKDVNVNTSASYNHEELLVSWKKFVCEDTHARVRMVAIQYCVSSSQQSKVCDAMVDEVLVPAEPTSHLLTGLTPGTRYLVRLQSVTMSGRSEITNPKFISTTQTWATGGMLAVLIICSLISGLIVIAAFYCMYRRCDKCRTKFTAGLEIIIPDVVKNNKTIKTSSSSQAAMLDPYNQQVSLHLDRQITRISNYSGDADPSSPHDMSQASPLLSRHTVSPSPRPHNTSDDVFISHDYNPSMGSTSITSAFQQQQPYVQSNRLNGFLHPERNHPGTTPDNVDDYFLAEPKANGYIDHADNNLLDIGRGNHCPARFGQILPTGKSDSPSAVGGLGGYVSHDGALFPPFSVPPLCYSEDHQAESCNPSTTIAAVIERPWDSSGPHENSGGQSHNYMKSAPQLVTGGDFNNYVQNGSQNLPGGGIHLGSGPQSSKSNQTNGSQKSSITGTNVGFGPLSPKGSKPVNQGPQHWEKTNVGYSQNHAKSTTPHLVAGDRNKELLGNRAPQIKSEIQQHPSNNSSYVMLNDDHGAILINPTCDLNGSFQKSDQSSGFSSLDQDAWLHNGGIGPNSTSLCNGEGSCQPALGSYCKYPFNQTSTMSAQDSIRDEVDNSNQISDYTQLPNGGVCSDGKAAGVGEQQGNYRGECSGDRVNSGSSDNKMSDTRSSKQVSDARLDLEDSVGEQLDRLQPHSKQHHQRQPKSRQKQFASEADGTPVAVADKTVAAKSAIPRTISSDESLRTVEQPCASEHPTAIVLMGSGGYVQHNDLLGGSDAGLKV